GAGAFASLRRGLSRSLRVPALVALAQRGAAPRPAPRALFGVLPPAAPVVRPAPCGPGPVGGQAQLAQLPLSGGAAREDAARPAAGIRPRRVAAAPDDRGIDPQLRRGPRIRSGVRLSSPTDAAHDLRLRRDAPGARPPPD